mgnify:CR=1 FL=1
MTDDALASPAQTPKQKVWDAPVRLVHWLFVLLTGLLDVVSLSTGGVHAPALFCSMGVTVRVMR